MLSLNHTNHFEEILQILKKSCTYKGEPTHEWVIPKGVYEEVIELLEEYDIITIDNEKEIIASLIPPSSIKKERKVFSVADLNFPPIKGKAPYESFQLEDIQKIYSRNRLAVFNDVGTGKSYEILSAIKLYKSLGVFNKILYITSNSGVYDIKEAFLNFTNITEDRITIGDKTNRRPFDLDVDVIICNYRSFLLISDEYQKDKDKGKKHTKNYHNSPIPIEHWLQGDKGCCVLDESHNIAIHSSRQTKALHLIAEFFEYRYIMTGTPADKEEKYYSQLKFLDTSLVRGLPSADWNNYYANVGTRFSPYAIASWKPDKLKELRDIVRDNCIRRLGEDVLELPEHIIKTLYVSMPPLQKDIYSSYIRERLRLLQSKEGAVKSSDVIKIFQSLLLTVDNPEIIDLSKTPNEDIKNKIAKFSFKKHHPKIKVIEDILADYPSSKVILWTSHPSVGNALADIFASRKPFVLNGEIAIPKGYTKDSYKQEVVTTFKNSPDRNLLIAGTQVLNSAVTIIEANVQIYIDTDFNYTTTDQSMARIYRIGQKQKVYTFKILIKNTLDVVRHKAMENKNFINEKFLTNEYLTFLDIQNMVQGETK